jgi:hypothetical protein
MRKLPHNPIKYNTEEFTIQDITNLHNIMNNLHFFQLRQDLEIMVTPPDDNTLVRFLFRKRGQNKTWSVYLDVSGSLGGLYTVYWELYPDSENTNSRYGFDEFELLLLELYMAVNKEYPPDD